jgi:hypothetical protein
VRERESRAKDPNKSKYKHNKIDLSKNIEKAKDFIEEITGERIKKKPTIRFFPISANEANIVVGYFNRRKMEILLSKELLNSYKYLISTFYHEFFHFATKVLKFYHFEEIPDLATHKFALSLRLLFVKEFPSEEMGINFIEEGTAQLFAATLISKNEKSIPKNMRWQWSRGWSRFERKCPQSWFYPALRDIYTTLHQINGVTKEEFAKIIDRNSVIKPRNINKISMKKLYNCISDTRYLKETATKYMIKYHKQVPIRDHWIITSFGYEVGDAITLFAYEIYKKEGKSVKQLLRDLIYSPYDVVEKVVREIKNDKTQKLLKDKRKLFEY